MRSSNTLPFTIGKVPPTKNSRPRTRQTMLIFSTLDKAKEHGFQWVEFRSDLNLHIVERTLARSDGKLARALAFAKKDRDEEEQPSDDEPSTAYPWEN